jgi:hypothetical protein
MQQYDCHGEKKTKQKKTKKKQKKNTTPTHTKKQKTVKYIDKVSPNSIVLN